MIYIVSGIRRSGTSMMMGCLVRSGINAYVDPRRENRIKGTNREDYQVNPEFYEVGSSNYMRFGFSTEVPENNCVKIQAMGLPILAAGAQYKIILMRRDPAEIRRSSKAAFPDENFDRVFPHWPSFYWNIMEGTKAIMAMRRDVELIEVWFDKLIEDPKRELNKLIGFGIPLNMDACLEWINPELYRHRA